MISVVIPAYNEEKYIGGVLRSLTQQQTTLPFEVIVVDNASGDKTAAVAQAFQDELNLTVVRESRKGRGAARRTGFAVAKGDIILSTDADAIVPPDWVQRMSTALTSAPGVSGLCYITDSSAFKNAAFNIIQPAVTVLNKLVFGYFWLVGSNSGIRRDIYVKAGGFNPRLNSHEDTELSARVNKIGRIQFIPSLRVAVSGRRFRRGLLLGLWDYISSFFERWFLRKQDTILDDQR